MLGDQYLGEIRIFTSDFAPEGWEFCDGRLVAISEHTALFSVLGTTYGGDGKSTFALPDMRNCVPVGAGAGPGLPEYDLGDTGQFVGAPATSRTPPSDISVLGVLPNLVVNFCIAIRGIYPSRA